MSQWQNRIVKHGQQPASQFVANPSNPRIHPQKQRHAVKASLDTLGWVAPVIVNANTGYLVDGHERLWQSLQQGDETPVPYIEIDLTEDEERQFLLTFDYMTYMATYDTSILQELIEDVQGKDAGIDALIDEMAGALDVALGDEAPIEDEGAVGDTISRADKLAKEWGTARGQVWLVHGLDGRVHRVMCGDSTSVEDVGRLMDGARADLMVTDPPYGVAMDKGFGGAVGFNGDDRPIARRVYGDDWDGERPAGETFNLLMGQARDCIIWGGNFFADLLPPSTHWIVWDKVQTMPTFGDCELAYTSIGRKSVKKYEVQYNGLIGKEAERYHPTQKPVKLFVQVIGDYSADGALIFDAYLGSGTTLIACEQVGRVCYGMELSEGYVGVILERARSAGMRCELTSPPSPLSTVREGGQNATSPLTARSDARHPRHE